MLMFRSKNKRDLVFNEVNKKYGPVFTFWMANKPFVFISDIDIARDTFRRTEFAGRPDTYFCNLISNDKHRDIVFTDYGQTWEALRRVSQTAVLKYSANDKLLYLVCNTVEDVIKTILTKEGANKEFIPNDYIYSLFLNILATSAFSRIYTINDPEFKKLKYIIKDFYKDIGFRFMLWEVSSFSRLLDRRMVNIHRNLNNEFIEWMENNFKSHLKDYDQSVERDFCNALISAKNEALREGKESAVHLTDVNLAMSIFDLFFAGIETSQKAFQ